jgi:microcystin-dependent protein
MATIIDSSAANGGVPKGAILMWSGLAAAIPAGWALCDGSNGTPDLVGKFIRGGSQAGDTGGADSVTLTEDNMPQHAHALSGSQTATVSTTTNEYNAGYPPILMVGRSVGGSGSLSFSFSLSGDTGSAGKASPDAVSTLPAYYTLCYIMKIS